MISQFTGVPQDKVIDVILWLQSLIYMVVSGEDNIDTVFLEEGNQRRAQVQIRSVKLSVRIKRMVEVADLPRRRGISQLLFHPIQLFRVHVGAVERKKGNVILFETVIALASHVKQLVQALVGIVMVSQRGVKLYPGIEQGLYGSSNLRVKSRGLSPP